MLLLSFQNTNPERGRKPLFYTTTSTNSKFNFRTQTPKGDGNLSQGSYERVRSAFQNTNPERGRKLSRPSDHAHTAMFISEHKPRKGTETGASPQRKGCFRVKFQNTNPERGRKHREGIPCYQRVNPFQNTNPERGRKQHGIPRHKARGKEGFQNTNPERGRKQSPNTLLAAASAAYFRTQTPKGDGNNMVFRAIRRGERKDFRTQTPKGDGNSRPIPCLRQRRQRISEHKPRKGTETFLLLLAGTHVFAYFRTQTPKGDGNGRQNQV